MRLFAAILLTCTFGLAQEQTGDKPLPRVSEVMKESKEHAKEEGAVFGKIKQVEAGKRLVIQVDNAPDKEYSLANPKKPVTVADGLAIGDRVRVFEDKKGIQIVKDVRPQANQQRGRANTDRK